MIPLLALATLTGYTYWVEPCVPAASQCKPEDTQLAEWALTAWHQASGGAVTFRRVEKREEAQFRFIWAAVGRAGLFGEVRPIEVNGQRGAEIYIRPALEQFGPHIATIAAGDPLFRETIVYLTCLHESGHALGLPHTPEFEDAMYSFQNGGDVLEYFLRYSRRLRQRDDIVKHSGLSSADIERLRELLVKQTASAKDE